MAGLRKLLIANRGEIAVRIVSTARALGIRTVAVYSEADADALHVEVADEAVCIGPPAAAESYLAIDRIIEAARRTGADAIHPGYGFLAENAGFAQAVGDAGIVFVGPPPAAISLMGDKARAKARMLEAGVPCVPGYQGSAQDASTLSAEADKIGFPLLVKAAAGGGGRGMRKVLGKAELSAAITSARSEAENAFGSGDLLLERVVQGARHVEIQVFADAHGRAIHLGERECSAQRRHQKIIEEAPSPAVDPDLRARMGEAAVTAAKAIGYEGAGTVEFLLDESGAFYFLEMNTRLQVEHPVTELITGLDLVDWQLRVAQGASLPLSQQEVEFDGHAIEVRIYAEDPYSGFLPQTGRVELWRPPARPGVRFDVGVREGQEVSPYYDPMIAKVIGYGDDRESARRRLITALEDAALLGPRTNRRFLIDLLDDELFVTGGITTETLDKRYADGPPERPAPSPVLWALGAVFLAVPDGMPDAWRSTGVAAWTQTVEWDQKRNDLRVSARPGHRWHVELEQVALDIRVVGVQGPHKVVEIDGVRQSLWVVRSEDGRAVQLDLGGRGARFTEPQAVADEEVVADGRLVAPMNGKVLAVHVEAGQQVEAGETVAVLEAMKMEHRIVAPAAGTVESVKVAQGDQVRQRELLVNLELQQSNRQE